VPKVIARIGQVLPLGFPCRTIPVQERLLGISVMLPELSQSSLADYSHRRAPGNNLMFANLRTLVKPDEGNVKCKRVMAVRQVVDSLMSLIRKD
jgi:hypothetical protein